MIDPSKITNFNLTKIQLEEHILFWALVAGKPAKTTAKNLNNLLRWLRAWYADQPISPQQAPFRMLRDVHAALSPTNPNWLADKMKELGIGCYNHKARACLELAHSGLNLQTCPAEDLEKIHGIGMKTSRCFIMHSRENSDYAGLDTHVLAFLRDLGYDVPKNTPSSTRKYQDIETKFLYLAQVASRSPAHFDLLIWRIYSQHPQHKSLLIQTIQNRIKTFKFSTRYIPRKTRLHVYSDGEGYIIAKNLEEAQHILSELDIEDFEIEQLDDNISVDLMFNGKKRLCSEWCKLLGPGIVPN
jgi:thermostable 8-oxoguanine DNA glycosylase